ncbi:histidine kinase dimerization/phospho-acceptor domain-containing protein [Sphingomonas oligophenolica]|uniref:histidine kinase n=1 Tax=Sphingomonas oligophenolica TaxID=301154 RepID=A0ABU9Y9J4_9SPHN
MSTSFGAQSAWRQLVDLIGRRRVPPSAGAIAKLRSIRNQVPPSVRAASARGAAFADPPAALVELFAEDELSIAAPVLRTARLRSQEWIEMLPGLSPATRSVLRHRRDLAPAVCRALESFGSVDFVLPAAAAEIPVEPEIAVEPAAPIRADTVAEEPLIAAASVDWTEIVGPIEVEEPLPVIEAESVGPIAVDSEAVETIPEPEPAGPTTMAPETPLAPAESSFVSLASVALGLPVVAEALRQTSAEAAESTATAEPESEIPPEPAEQVRPSAAVTALRPPPAEASTGVFQIAELVARIDAYQRQREVAAGQFAPAEVQPELFELDANQAPSFRFETDVNGVVRWIEGAARAPLIGLSLDLAALPAGSRVDGVATGAFRRRAGFTNARLVVDGNSDAAGQWRITGIPVFDRETGRFTGYRGTARRPRPDESAEPIHDSRNAASDALRQLVHELRTPTNAIAGFAEMIESQMLGPVPQAYRAQAAMIRGQAGDLLAAIDDIDMAARIESRALDLRPGDVAVGPLLEHIADDLAPLARLRGASLDIYTDGDTLAIDGDDRAVERLIARLMATLVASGSAGERIGISATRDADAMVAIVFDRPRALAAYAGDALLSIDVETESGREGAPLLGTGFALRLARNLAAELRGTLAIGDNTLTLRLPAAVIEPVEQVSSS